MRKLNVRICEKSHTDWMSYCEEIGKTSSELVRGFIARNVTDQPRVSDPQILRNRQRKTQINVYLTESEIQSVTWRSERSGGTRAKWIIGVIRSAIARQPSFEDNEIIALKESTEALNAIGRNLNQIARSLHKNEMPDRAVKIEQVVSDIRKHTDGVQTLIDVARSRWEIA